jgi:hypothetical protein
MASPSLLAHLVTSKFDDGIPLYRVSRQLERSGMELSPGTAATWVNRIGGDKVIPLIELLREAIFIPELMHMDESYLQVLNSDKAPTSTHYMVVRAAGPPGTRIILYDYIPSRTREALKQLLVRPEGPYRGKLLTDGLEHYDDICQELKLLHFGCWQHVFSLVMTARANGVEPFEYLSYLFEHLPSASTVEAIEALLPRKDKPLLKTLSSSV